MWRLKGELFNMSLKVMTRISLAKTGRGRTGQSPRDPVDYGRSHSAGCLHRRCMCLSAFVCVTVCVFVSMSLSMCVCACVCARSTLFVLRILVGRCAYDVHYDTPAVNMSDPAENENVIF